MESHENVQQEGGGILKLICEGTNQCIFVMFPSPQPMFGIYFRLVLVIFLLQVGGVEKCKFYMRGCQTMHICDVSKPSANACEGAKHWFFLGGIFAMFPSPQQMFEIYFRLVLVLFVTRGGGNVKLMCEGPTHAYL